MLDCAIGRFGNTSDKEPPTNYSDHMDSALFATGSLYLSEYTALPSTMWGKNHGPQRKPEHKG